MQRLYATLSEKDLRRYAGIEAAKHGTWWHWLCVGVIRNGSQNSATRPNRIGITRRSRTEPGRKKSAGRKVSIEHKPMLAENFLKLLTEFTAGDPMREGVLWTNLSHCEISRRLAEMGTSARQVE